MRYKVEFFKDFENAPIERMTERFETYVDAENWLKDHAALVNEIAFRQPWRQVPHDVKDGRLDAPRGQWRISEDDV